MEHGRGGRCQYASGTQGDEAAVKSDDEAVVGLNALHKCGGNGSQGNQFH